VHRDPRVRRHAADLAERLRGPGRLHAGVTARRGRRMRAVTVVVAYRVEFPWALGGHRLIAAPARVVILRADQLLIAHRRIELLAGGALAVPAGNLVIAQTLVLVAAAIRARAIGKAQAFGPDAGIDHADDDAVAGVIDAAELVP